MTATEGVVKFQLEFSAAPALPAAMLAELNAWRQFLCLTKLIGQDPTDCPHQLRQDQQL